MYVFPFTLQWVVSNRFVSSFTQQIFFDKKAFAVYISWTHIEHIFVSYALFHKTICVFISSASHIFYCILYSDTITSTIMFVSVEVVWNGYVFSQWFVPNCKNTDNDE